MAQKKETSIEVPSFSDPLGKGKCEIIRIYVKLCGTINTHIFSKLVNSIVSVELS